MNFGACDVLFEFMHREDPCISLCDKIPVELPNEGGEGVLDGRVKVMHLRGWR